MPEQVEHTPMSDKQTMEQLAWLWAAPKIERMESKPTDCLVFYNAGGHTAEFYNFNTDETWPSLFITIPMMNILIDGRNPKNVKNKYVDR